MNDKYKQALAVLRTFLESAERKGICLDIDEFQGAMVAVASSPEYVSEVDFGFLVLGDDSSGEEKWFEEGEIRQAWVACWNILDEMLAMEQFSLQMLYDLHEISDAPPKRLSRWCEGYLQGYVLTEDAWQEAHQHLVDEEIEMTEEHLAVLNLMALLSHWDEGVAESDDPEKLRKNVSLLFKAIDEGVLKFHKLALLLENNRIQIEEDIQSSVRDSEKVGRNAPCPCGSGKKYKKCCLQ